MSLIGHLKTNKISLQGHGVFGENVTMEVDSDTFTMSMGSNILMTVSPEDVIGDINDSGTVTNTTLTIHKDTIIDGDLSAHNLTIRDDIVTENLEVSNQLTTSNLLVDQVTVSNMDATNVSASNMDVNTLGAETIITSNLNAETVDTNNLNVSSGKMTLGSGADAFTVECSGKSGFTVKQGTQTVLNQPPRPNVIIIVLDDMGYSDFGCYGSTIIQTSNIDALANKGLRFGNMFNAGYCGPTRGSLQTGLYPAQVGMNGNNVVYGAFYSIPSITNYNYEGNQGFLTRENNTLGEAARAAGYETYFSGKWHLGDLEPIVDNTNTVINRRGDYPTERGYTYWTAALTGAQTNFLNPDLVPRGGNFGPLDMVKQGYIDGVPSAAPTIEHKWDRFTHPYYTDPTSTNNGLGLFNPVTNYFKDRANFPYIPDSVCVTPNDGQFIYHHTDDTMYDFLDKLDKNVQEKPHQPFFVSVNFTAPHVPLQETPYYIKKYWTNYPEEPTEETCVFLKYGWDEYEAQVNAKQQTIGLLPNLHKLPRRNDNTTPWVDVSQADKVYSSKIMSIYAAMIHHVDDCVGALVKYLKDNELFDNTLITVMSDNGSEMHASEFGDNNNSIISMCAYDDVDESDTMGDYKLGGTYNLPAHGWGWGEVSSTPYRVGKGVPFKGGNQTPCVVSWPNGIPKNRNNTVVKQQCYIRDFMPTLVELTNSPISFGMKEIIYDYKEYNVKIPELESSSLVPLLTTRSPNPVIALERPPQFNDNTFWSGTSVYDNKWWLIRDWGRMPLLNNEEKYGKWALYNNITDPYQTSNLALVYPEKVTELESYYLDWVASTNDSPFAAAERYNMAIIAEQDVTRTLPLILDGDIKIKKILGTASNAELVPKQSFRNALIAEGKWAGSNVLVGSLADPHYESSIPMANNGFFKTCKDWDNNFNPESPELPALTYFYDNSMRVVIYANSNNFFFDQQSCVNTSFTYSSNINDVNYDPTVAAYPHMAQGRARFVFNLPYDYCYDSNVSTGYWNGGKPTSTGETQGQYWFNEGAERESTKSTSNVFYIKSAIRTMNEYEPTLSRNLPVLTNTDLVIKKVGLALRFPTKPDGSVDITNTMNYSFDCSDYYGVNLRLAPPITRNIYSTSNLMIDKIDNSSLGFIFFVKPLKTLVNDLVDYRMYLSNRYSLSILNGVNVDNTLEGMWSGLIVADSATQTHDISDSTYLLTSSGKSCGYRLDKNRPPILYKSVDVNKPYYRSTPLGILAQHYLNTRSTAIAIVI